MKIFEEFGISPILLLAQVVNFTILLVLLRLFLYKPVLKILEERKTKIAKSLKDAEEIEKRLADTQTEQEKLLGKAQTESSKLIAEAKEEAKELSEKTLAEARTAVEEMLAKNGQRLKLEREEMMSEVKGEIAVLVTAAAAKVVGKSVDQMDNKKMVDETIKEITEK